MHLWYVCKCCAIFENKDGYYWSGNCEHGISDSRGCKARNISNGPISYFVVFCDEARWRKAVKYTEYHKINPTNCNSHRLCSFAVRIGLQFSCLEFTYNLQLGKWSLKSGQY